MINLNPSQLISTFFGLTWDQVNNNRSNLFSQIHEIVFHGKGGYDWYTIYNMPIWLRKFTFNQIKKFHDDESKQIKNASQKGKNIISPLNPDGKVNSSFFKRPTKSSYK